jgi:cytochrome c oxidase cbb3-type subunit 2
VGGKYSDEWQRLHLISPRDLVPESIMPAYAWLEKTPADAATIQSHMVALRRVGVPYSDAEIAAAPAQVTGKTELDALIAYLQGLGLALK